MADLPRYVTTTCLHTGRLAFLAIIVSAGITLQILACALYNNWWPMLTVLMYVMLPMPLLFFAGSDTSSLFSCDGNWCGICLSMVKMRQVTNEPPDGSSMQMPLFMKVTYDRCNSCLPRGALFHPTLLCDGSLSADAINGSWVNAAKFLTGASAVGSIAIPAILKHANVIGWGALALELSSFFVFVVAIVCYLRMGNDDDYSRF